MTRASLTNTFAIALIAVAALAISALGLPRSFMTSLEEVPPGSIRLGQADRFAQTIRLEAFEGQSLLAEAQISATSVPMQVAAVSRVAGTEDGDAPQIIALGLAPATRMSLNGVPLTEATDLSGRLHGLGHGWSASPATGAAVLDDRDRIDAVAKQGFLGTENPRVFLRQEEGGPPSATILSSWFDTLSRFALAGAWAGLLASIAGLLVTHRPTIFLGALVCSVSELARLEMPMTFKFEQSLVFVFLVTSLAGAIMTFVGALKAESRWWRNAVIGCVLAAGSALGVAAAVRLGSPGLAEPLWILHFANTGLLPWLAIAMPLAALSSVRDYVVRVISAQEALKERDRIIAEQEVELEQTIRSQAILEERQRFVRDMHDGIGGQLVSLLMRLRGAAIPLERVEGEIEKGLADLRLVVDSLDHVGTDLNTALASFRGRASQQLSGAGIELRWSQSGSLDRWTFDAREILGIYRILQEAVTNAARHAKPASVSVSITGGRDPDDDLVITVEDDGIGFDQSKTGAGRGLSNIRQRAVRLSGNATIHSAPGEGTSVLIVLPKPARRRSG